MIDCKSTNRIEEIARNCGCCRCKQWWADNVWGYFLCAMCLEVTLKCNEYSTDGLIICEECLDEEYYGSES